MDLNQYARAIASIESAGSGDYQAVGPRTGKGNRAYGRYQVMDFNIGPWTEKYLGQRLTPEQFLASPEAQDAVFRGEFGSYIERYGNPQDAASAWFTGQPLSTGAGRSDILGTTGAGYVEKFNAALGQPQGGNMQPQGLLSTSGQAEPERLPFFQRPETKDFLSALAVGLGGLTLNPNQAIIQSAQQDIAERRKTRETAAQQNRTLEYLRGLGTPQAKEALRYAEGTGDIFGALKMVTPGDTPAAFRSLQAQAEAAGLQPGTPEYQEFMLYGGGRRESTPASFVALDLQARSAGFVPRSEGGDGRYEEFMATAGKGLSAQAAAEGRARGQATFDLAGAEVAATRALNLVDLLRNDPALPDMVGPVQGRLPNVSGAAQRFQSRLDQLQGTAFLEAYNMLRGGGQITEVEGQKAERAIARLNVAQNEEDFLTALDEFEDAIRTGLQKLTAQAGAQPAGGRPTGQTRSPSMDDPLGLRRGQ